MIKKITLSKCSPFEQAEISDCKKINFLYGSNGSGKSTIGCFLSGEDKSDRFSESSIEWDSDLHETIYVYNRNFRNDNFKQIIPGVFTLGSATIDDINELENLKKECDVKKDDLRKRLGTYNRYKDELIPAREELFKNDVWTHILKANEEEFQKAFEGLRGSKDRFVAELKRRINGVTGSGGIICQRDSLISRAKAIYASTPVWCERLEINIDTWLSKIEEIRLDSIWSTVIAGNEDVDIATLIKELGNSSWVNQGRFFIQQNSRKCPFCQQETISDEFRTKLETFFDEEYNRRILKMRKLCEEYHTASERIITAIKDAVQSETVVAISRINLDVYYAKTDLLCSLLSEQENKMSVKISEPGRKVTINDVSSIIQEIRDLITDANNKVDSHNKLVDERDVEEKKLTADVWATIINDSDSLIKTYQKDIMNLEKARNGIKRALDIKRKEVEDLEAIIIEKGQNVTSVQPAINEINRLLKAYGFTSFSIQPSSGRENGYCIVRNDGSLVNNTLSEGEETFLTFLYFMQWTKGAIDPEHIFDKKIIVLDDPVSSLDSTILYIVGAMVKDLARKIKDGIGDVDQLFVLTHNVFFHKEASFDPRKTMGKNINFWIIRKDNDISDITSYLADNPISTSYELLWEELRDNKKMSNITIQNSMRRILENYFGIVGKDKDEILISHFESVDDQIIARSLINWIHDGSHSIPDDYYIDSYTDAVPKYKAVFREIFKMTGQLSHYNMMMRIDDSSEE